MSTDFSVQDGLPEGAVPLDEKGALVAQSVAVGASPDKKPVFAKRGAIELTLPDGRKVGMDVPKMAISRLVAGVMKDVEFKDPKLQVQEMAQVRSLLYVTDIDGVPVEKPYDELSRLKLEQDLGIDGTDAVLMAFMEHFPPVDNKDLVIVKKF